MRVVAGLLSLLLLLPAAARADESAAALARDEGALAARWEALREGFEAELGPLDPPPRFLPATRRELARLIASESAALYADMEAPPQGIDLRALARDQADLLAGACFGKLDPAPGHVLILPETFRALAGAAPELWGIDTPRFLDVILIHEAAHVWQHRRFGLGAVFTPLRDEEDLRARMCVVEGHAQVVTRAVAARLGLEAELALLVRANVEVPSTVTDPSLRLHLQTLTAIMAVQYVDGERFVATVLERLGAPEGLSRLFAAPPRTLRAVSHPAEYLDPPAEDRDVGAIARAVRDLLPGPWTRQVVAVPDGALRAALAPAGADAVAWVDSGLRLAVACVGSDPAVPGRSVMVTLLRCASEAAAEEMLALEERVSRAKDEQFSRPGMVRIRSAAYEAPEVDGLPGLYVDKQLTTQAGPMVVRTLVVRQGDLVLEVMAVHDASWGKAEMQGLCRAALALWAEGRR